MNSRTIQQLLRLAQRLPPKYWILIAVFGGGYFFAEPILERTLGRPLPGFNNNSVVQAELDQRRDQKEFEQANSADPVTSGQLGQGQPSISQGESSKDNRKQLNDLFDQQRNQSKNTSNQTGNADSKKTLPNIATRPPVNQNKTGGGGSTSTASNGNAKLGVLKDVGRGSYESTAGLLYTRGSAEGHRLKHIERHLTDQPNRPVHGVFDGDRAAMLAIVDEAYLKAKSGGRGVKKETQDRRTVYTVDLGRKIGFVGGQVGSRKNKPKATKLKLILEGNKVITAYPTSY